MCGGLFVVPINAALQEIGHRTIGSGGAVAIQNFFENLAMLLTSGTYALVAGLGVDPVVTMLWLGALVVVATLVVSLRLPQDTLPFGPDAESEVEFFVLHFMASRRW